MLVVLLMSANSTAITRTFRTPVTGESCGLVPTIGGAGRARDKLASKVGLLDDCAELPYAYGTEIMSSNDRPITSLLTAPRNFRCLLS